MIEFCKKNQGILHVGANEWFEVYEKWAKREKLVKVSAQRFGRTVSKFALKERKQKNIVYSAIGSEMINAVLKEKLHHEYDHRKQFAPKEKDERRQQVVKVVRVEFEDALYRFRDFVNERVDHDKIDQSALQELSPFGNVTNTSPDQMVRSELLQLLDAFIAREQTK